MRCFLGSGIKVASALMLSSLLLSMYVVLGLQSFNLQHAQATHAPQEQQSQTNLQFQEYQAPVGTVQVPLDWKVGQGSPNLIKIKAPDGLLIEIFVQPPTSDYPVYSSVQSPLSEISQNMIQQKSGSGFKLISSKELADQGGPRINNIYVHTQTGTYQIEYIFKLKSGLLFDFAYAGTQSQIEKYDPIIGQIFQSVRIDPNYQALIASQIKIIEQMKGNIQDSYTDTLNIPGDYMADLADSFGESAESLSEYNAEKERCEDPRSLGC